MAAAETLQSPKLQGLTAIDPASPAGIEQAKITLLGQTLTATVDAAVHRGLEQLHLQTADSGTENPTCGGQNISTKG